MDALTATLKALADPTRRTIVEILRTGSRSVSDLVEHFSMSRPAVSKHLSILRDAGLVRAKRDGRQQIYRLDAKALEPVRKWLEPFGRGGERRAAASKRPPRRQTAPKRPAPRRRPGRTDDWKSW